MTKCALANLPHVAYAAVIDVKLSVMENIVLPAETLIMIYDISEKRRSRRSENLIFPVRMTMNSVYDCYQ